ncbi:hypothetical protein ACFLZT_04675 [Thermodesulfobacteriota bacterium]
MKGVTELIKEHKEYIQRNEHDDNFYTHHLTQIGFLQHERLVHLIVMLFVILASLIFLGLFLVLDVFLFLVVFILLIILTLFYIFHYYKLENTVIEWYFIFNEKQ